MGYVDFKAVKERVSIEDVLTRYCIRLHRVGRALLRGKCPLPTHTSKASAQSFSVNTLSNVWSCHSASCSAARGGEVGGNVLDFVALMESCSVREAAVTLQEQFMISGTPRLALPPKLATAKQPVEGNGYANHPLPFTLSGVDPTHPYMADRGIIQEVARSFGVGFFRGRGSMAGRVVIPIHDEAGRLVAYAGRSIDGAEPKYRFPRGFVKSAVLFNLHRVTAQEVIVVEGFFDCIRVWQSLNPFVVALMGSTMSRWQEETLTRRFKFVTLMLDGDDAGRRASEKIAGRLVRQAFVRIVEVPAGMQPDQLLREDLDRLLRS